MPSTAAASASSRVRTPARSPSGTSAGSLIDPDSPRDPQRSTTRAPASASRASVPPHASDSSSGCAKTARTVRPASGRSTTMLLHDTKIDRDVLFDHAGRAEPRDGPLADAPTIQIEQTRQLVHHLLEVGEHHPGHAVVDYFTNRATIERRDGVPPAIASASTRPNGSRA